MRWLRRFLERLSALSCPGRGRLPRRLFPHDGVAYRVVHRTHGLGVAQWKLLDSDPEFNNSREIFACNIDKWRDSDGTWYCNLKPKTKVSWAVSCGSTRLCYKSRGPALFALANIADLGGCVSLIRIEEPDDD